MLPIRAIQTQENLPWWEMDDEQRDEKSHVQLAIPEGAVCPSLLRLRGTYTRHMSAQVVMIDALCGNHRQKHVNQALKGVDSEATRVRFEVLGECGSLLDSGFCGLHTFRTPQSVGSIKLDGAD